jgi:hypothetical protein
MKRLYRIRIDNDGTDNNYKLIPDDNSKSFGASEYAIRADIMMLKNFLRRCKVADVDSKPRSYRSLTYKDIVDLIHNQKGEVYIFSHMYPKSQIELDKIMRS